MPLAPACHITVKDRARPVYLPVAWPDTGPTARQMQPRLPAGSGPGGDVTRRGSGRRRRRSAPPISSKGELPSSGGTAPNPHDSGRRKPLLSLGLLRKTLRVWFGLKRNLDGNLRAP